MGLDQDITTASISKITRHFVRDEFGISANTAQHIGDGVEFAAGAGLSFGQIRGLRGKPAAKFSGSRVSMPGQGFRVQRGFQPTQSGSQVLLSRRQDFGVGKEAGFVPVQHRGGGTTAAASGNPAIQVVKRSHSAVIKGERIDYSFKSVSGIFKKTPIEWTAPVGTKQTYRVYQKTDIDWSQVRTTGAREFVGKTNLEAAKQGHPPQLPNGSFVQVHHLGQDVRGGLVEASDKYHSFKPVMLSNGKTSFEILHGQYGLNGSHPEYPVNHKIWSAERKVYWQQRVAGVE